MYKVVATNITPHVCGEREGGRTYRGGRASYKMSKIVNNMVRIVRP